MSNSTVLNPAATDEIKIAVVKDYIDQLAKRCDFKPYGDRLLTHSVEPPDRTKSGLYLPSDSQQKPLYGVVIAVGPGPLEEGKERELKLDVGQVVVYGRFNGQDIKLEGTQFKILREAELLGDLGGIAKNETYTLLYDQLAREQNR